MPHRMTIVNAEKESLIALEDQAGMAKIDLHGLETRYHFPTHAQHSYSSARISALLIVELEGASAVCSQVDVVSIYVWVQHTYANIFDNVNFHVENLQ